MIRQTWHKRTVRRLLASIATGGVLVAVGLHGCTPAHADSDLSNVQVAYIQAYGAGAICPTIDEFHTIPGVIGVTKGVMADGFTAAEAVQIVNVAVATFCPRDWPLLQQVGAAARAAVPVKEQIL